MEMQGLYEHVQLAFTYSKLTVKTPEQDNGPAKGVVLVSLLLTYC